MPAYGSVYLRDVSGHAAAIDGSGFLYVNVNGTLSVGSVNVSGNVLSLASGTGPILTQFPANNYSGVAATLSGLQVVTTVNSTTNISGQVVYTTSGNNLVQIASGYNAVIISGAPSMWSGIVVCNSGQTVTPASGTPLGVSGQTISLVSGTAVTVQSGVWLASGLVVNISGQSVTTTVSIGSVTINSGNFFVMSGFIQLTSGSMAAISGVFVNMSGQGVTPNSGIYIASGIVPNISGQTVTFASGAGATLSGITVLASITTNISGNAIIFTSGQNLVQLGSGVNFVSLSGTTNISGLGVVVQSGLGTVLASGLWLASGIVPGSGIQVASGIIPNISGQAVTISGNQNNPTRGNPTMASGFGFSGAVVVVPAMYDFSGQNWVPMSAANISGANSALGIAQTPATKIFVGYSGTVVQSGMTSNSGGDPLTGKSGTPISIGVFQVTVRNLSGNNTVYVGGSGNRPFSGAGFPLYGGDGLTQSITDASLIYVFAATSGQFIQWIGQQY